MGHWTPKVDTLMEIIPYIGTPTPKPLFRLSNTEICFGNAAQEPFISLHIPSEMARPNPKNS